MKICRKKGKKIRKISGSAEGIDSLSELAAAYLTAPNITRLFDRARPTLWCKQTATEARHFADKLVLTECRSPRKRPPTKIPAARPRECLSSNESSRSTKKRTSRDQFSGGPLERVVSWYFSRRFFSQHREFRERQILRRRIGLCLEFFMQHPVLHIIVSTPCRIERTYSFIRQWRMFNLEIPCTLKFILD